MFEGVNLSRTRKKERGNGLKTIYDNVKKDKHIANFTLITNKLMVKLSTEEDQFIVLQTPFNGTLYSWDLQP
mgnify:FL=1